MAIKTYFPSLTSPAKKDDVIPGTGDWYIQQYVYIGTGVYALSTAGVSTLTPATSPAWTDDELISTVARNLLVVDDNNVVASAKVADNSATAITFDETDCLLESDGVTAASFTVASTYSIYVLTPCSVAGQVYGPYFGYAEGVDVQITDEIIEHYSSFPEALQFRDLKRRTGTISGGHVNLVNKDVMSSIFNASNYGDNTGNKEEIAIGSGAACATLPTFRLAIKSTDRACKTVWHILRQVQFSANGSIFGDSTGGYKMVNFNGAILADGFYTGASNMIQIKRSA